MLDKSSGAVYSETPDNKQLLAAGGASRWEEGRVLAAGFTDMAYDEHRSHRLLHHTISVRDVPELRSWCVQDDGTLRIGAATPIGALNKILLTLKKNSSTFTQHYTSLNALVTQARYFANENVRHTGSIGGGIGVLPPTIRYDPCVGGIRCKGGIDFSQRRKANDTFT